jgi:hypothetical protein
MRKMAKFLNYFFQNVVFKYLKAIFCSNMLALERTHSVVYEYAKKVESYTCSLSLWRVVRGSKLMHLDLIHGLFIT